MTTNKQLFWLGITLISGWVIYLLSPVLMPFLVGATLAYLGDPLVDKLESFKFPRTLGVIVVFLVTFMLVTGVLIILIPTVSLQVQTTFEKAPEAFSWLNQTAIPWLNQHFKLNFSASTNDIQNWLQQHWQDTSAILQQVLSGLGNSSMVLVAWIGNLLLIPVVAFYLLRDWDKLVAYIGELIPRKQSAVVFQLARESDEVLGAFVRGQLLVMLALGIIYSVGLWLSGLQVALLVGMIAGAASIVPYLGFAVGIIIASIAALLQFHTIGSLIPVFMVFIVGQALEGMVLTPLLVGDKIGLHPVTVIFAVLAGGQLFGFVGILIALPLAAVIAVIMRHLHRRYRQSEFYDDAKPDKKIVIDPPLNKKGQSSA